MELEKEFAEATSCGTREKCMERFDRIIKKFQAPALLPCGSNRLIELCHDNFSSLISTEDDMFEKRFFAFPFMDYIIGDVQGVVEKLRSVSVMYLFARIAAVSSQKGKTVATEICNILRRKYSFDDRKANCCELFDGERLFICEFKRQIVSILIGNDKNFESLLCDVICKKFPLIYTGSSFAYLRYTFNIMNLLNVLREHEAQRIFSVFLTKMQEFDCDSLFQRLQKKENGHPDGDLEEQFHMETDPLEGPPQPDFDEWKIRADVVESTFLLVSDFVNEHVRCLTTDNNNSTISTNVMIKQDPDANVAIKHEENDDNIVVKQEVEQNFCTKVLASREEAERMLELITSAFFEIGLSASFHHFQWILFQAASKSSQYTSAFVQNLWSLATACDENLLDRFAAFGLLKSFFIVANFLPSHFVHDFLKNLLDHLHRFLDAHGDKSVSNSFSDEDIMFVTMTAGFIEIFCVVHSSFESIQLHILKSFNLKRILLENNFNPISYLDTETREAFQKLVIYYRVGYHSFSGFKIRKLQSMNENLSTHSINFGGIAFESIRSRFKTLVRMAHSFKRSSFQDKDHRSSTPHKRRRVDSEVYGSPRRNNFSMRSRANTSRDMDTSETSDDNVFSSSYNSSHDVMSSNRFLEQMLDDL